jgi:multiple sugar transport system substrate-binding protein
VTIEWMSYFNPQDLGRLGKTFLPSYEKGQKDVAVEVIIGPGGIIDSQQKYLTLTAAGVPPDLFGNTRPATNLAQQGLYADLSSLIKRDHFDLTKYNQQWLQTQADYKGGVYGLPLSVHAEAPAMVYNRDLFQKAGVPEPPAKWGDDAWTWEIFLDAARKLTVPGPSGTLTQAGVDSLAYSVHLPVLWEGNWVTPQLDKATCATQPMIDTYTNYSDLMLKYKVMPGPTLKLAPGGFQGGVSAMSTMGSWEFGVYQTLDKVNWAFMPFPKAKRSAYAFDPNMAYVAKSSKHLEETWNFVKWLDNGSNYALFFNFMPVIATDTATWSKTFFQSKPNVRPEVLVESLAIAQGIDPMFRVKGSDAFVRDHVETALASIIAGKSEVAATLQGVQPLLQGLVDQSPK